MRCHDTVLLVIDVQERLLAVQPQGQRTTWNIRRLLDAAKLLGVQTAATEQSPEKLGPTLPLLKARIESQAAGKTSFSSGCCGDVVTDWKDRGIFRVLVTGMETHVCVQQTAVDLMAAGYQVLVAVDAICARNQLDHDIALRRMEASGALLTTTEAAMFEWCADAEHPQFRQISTLVKESPPED